MFGRKAQIDADGFCATRVALQELQAGEMVRTKVAGKRVVLALVDGAVAAFGDTCPHGAASLAAGTLRGEQVCCPEHGYCFNVRHGRIVWPEDEVYRLARYEVKVVDGRISVRPCD